MRDLVERPDDVLLQHFDRCLTTHGDTAQGAHWPNEKDRRTRFDVMLDVIEPAAKRPIVLCDLACGTGELLAQARRRDLNNLVYVGVDRSRLALTHARRKFPDASFLELDVNADDADLSPLACDYLVSNGLFTVKLDLTHQQMWSFMETTIRRVWPHVRRGIAFNVMSKIVDWERDDLFHVPFDDCARLLHSLAGRRVRFRADYGLYEYTAYAYKHDQVGAAESEPLPEIEHRATRIPVLRPQLPRAERIVPYLHRIDATRTYSNYGPLVAEFEDRIAQRLRIPTQAMVSASSGTTALVGAVLATAGRATAQKPLALVPAFTFVATAAALERCGYRCHLVDVDPKTWMLDPAALHEHPLLEHVGVVVPVAPFGRPIDQQSWREFRDATGIPVVIDGAASFDTILDTPRRYIGDVPLVLSFHATKSFATGEGGGIATSNVRLADDIRKALNYGFKTARDSRSPSTNGKMSEYHAAVGLAELDGWTRKRAQLRRVAKSYGDRFAKLRLRDRLFASPTIGASYVLFEAASVAEALAIQGACEDVKIDLRMWYGGGLQHQTYFSDLSHDSLPVTEAIAPRLLGLPMAPDLSESAIARIAAAVAKGIADSRKGARSAA